MGVLGVGEIFASVNFFAFGHFFRGRRAKNLFFQKKIFFCAVLPVFILYLLSNYILSGECLYHFYSQFFSHLEKSKKQWTPATSSPPN